MGLKQSSTNEKKLSEVLGLDVATVTAALKESSVGGFARVWCADIFDNYSKARVSTWRKNRNSNSDSPTYETDFQNGYVSFLGEAHSKIKKLNLPTSAEYLDNRENESWGKEHKGIVIQVTSCEAQNTYDHETEKAYNNYIIWSFDVPERNEYGASTSKKSSAKAVSKAKTPAFIEQDDESDLPF